MIVEEKVDWLIKSVPVEKRKNRNNSKLLGIPLEFHSSAIWKNGRTNKEERAMIPNLFLDTLSQFFFRKDSAHALTKHGLGGLRTSANKLSDLSRFLSNSLNTCFLLFSWTNFQAPRKPEPKLIFCQEPQALTPTKQRPLQTKRWTWLRREEYVKIVRKGWHCHGNALCH